jgi:hypothetical protein
LGHIELHANARAELGKVIGQQYNQKCYSTRRMCGEISATGLTLPRNFDRSSSAT